MIRINHVSARWTGTFIRAGWLLAVAVSWVHVFQVHAAQQASPTLSYTTNVADKVACDRRLNLIYGAIQQYRKQHEDLLPRKLSDLMPDFLNDPNDLVCPFVLTRGGLRTWNKHFTEVSPDAYTSYSYELSSEPLPYNVWRGVDKKTWREFKLRVMQEVGPVVPIVRCHDHRPWLNLAYNGQIYESDLYWEKNFMKDDHLLTPSRLYASSAPRPRLGPDDFPPRDARADTRLIDLTAYYNAALTNSWQGFEGNHLAGLPAGLQEFGGVRFDVRGVIQLHGTEILIEFPDRVDGIKVHQKCRRIHFLHAASFPYRSKTTNGLYTFHYVDSRVEVMPVVYGKQTSDWWFNPDKPAGPTNATVAWVGGNQAAKAYGRSIRLYLATWENPRPDIEVATISFVVGPTIDGPFLVAITVE